VRELCVTAGLYEGPCVLSRRHSARQGVDVWAVCDRGAATRRRMDCRLDDRWTTGTAVVCGTWDRCVGGSTTCAYSGVDPGIRAVCPPTRLAGFRWPVGSRQRRGFDFDDGGQNHRVGTVLGTPVPAASPRKASDRVHSAAAAPSPRARTHIISRSGHAALMLW